MDKFLIKNTTKEQREKIVKDSLGYGDIGCDDADDGYEMYRPYINGEKEIAEITAEYRANYISETMEYTSGKCNIR